jgi:hypothetical protein
MNLLALKQHLHNLEQIQFELPNGTYVPSHFHLTEVGSVKRHFMDCGGTLRKEEAISLQLWNAKDYDHRLHPDKLLGILEMAQKSLHLEDHLPIEVEYQGLSIEKYGLEFNGHHFLLRAQYTDCLAKDACGISEAHDAETVPSIPKLKVKACTPGSGCC